MQEAIGHSKGGLTTKIHTTCDALGNPTGFHLTPGQAHDLEGADALLPSIDADTVIADKAFDADERVIEPLQKASKNIVIPPKSNRKNKRQYDEDLYKARHLIAHDHESGQPFSSKRPPVSDQDRHGVWVLCSLRPAERSGHPASDLGCTVGLSLLLLKRVNWGRPWQRCGSCAGTRPGARPGLRCGRCDRGWHRRKSDRRSCRASDRPAPGWRG